MSASTFAERLYGDLVSKLQADDQGDVVVNADESGTDDMLSSDLIKHWLNFAVYYERAAVVFIGGWLKTTEETDALVHFSHQIEDEANHYRWLKQHLSCYVDDVNAFAPPLEWKFLMEDFYPNLPTLIERLAAHNIAAETGAMGFAEFYFNRFPDPIKITMKKVLRDERYHIAFGKRLLNKYCKSEADKNLARSSAYASLQHMRKAREVFVTI